MHDHVLWVVGHLVEELERPVHLADLLRVCGRHHAVPHLVVEVDPGEPAERVELECGQRRLLVVGAEAADIQRAIDSEVQKIITTLENEVRASQEEVNKLNTAIGRARGQLITNNRNQVRLNELERDAEASRVLYEDFISRAKETGEQDDLAEADARILSSASVPTSPSSPKTAINLALGLILGGLVGIGLAGG